jgi:hypothetical protein
LALSRRRALATLGGSVLTLTGCQSPVGSAQPPGEPADDRIIPILTRRTDALRSGDENAWLADVDPSNAVLLAHERLVFANLRQFDFVKAEFRLNPGAVLTPKPVRYANSLPMRSRAYEVELRLQLRDVDTAENSARYLHVFGLVDDALKLVDVGAAADGAGAGSDFLLDYPWDLAALRVRRRGDVILAADSSVAELDEWVTAAGRASSTVRRDWGDNPAPKAFALFLTARSDAYQRWFGSNPAWSEGVQLPVRRPRGVDVSPGDDHFVGSRIVVNLAADRAGTPYETMKHQLTHAVSIAVIPPRSDLTGTPGPPRDTLGAARWATEGFARYIETREAPALRDLQRAIIRDGMRRRLFTGELPGNATFYAEPARAFNHALGYSLFQYVSSRYGHAKAVALYVAAVRQSGGDGPTGGTTLFAALGAVGLLDQRAADPRTSAFYLQWTRWLRQL